MRRSSSPLLAIFAAVISSGCAIVAPTYSPSLENITTLKKSGEYSVKVADFTSINGPQNEKTISIRGSSMSSPKNESYASYLADALKTELDMAKKLSPSADTVISGELLRNDIDASGFSMGYGDIAARFIVKRGNQTRYEQVKSAHTEWESSFAGAIAIPTATQAYPMLVQKLIAELTNDKSFIEALK